LREKGNGKGVQKAKGLRRKKGWQNLGQKKGLGHVANRQTPTEGRDSGQPEGSWRKKNHERNPEEKPLLKKGRPVAEGREPKKTSVREGTLKMGNENWKEKGPKEGAKEPNPLAKKKTTTRRPGLNQQDQMGERKEKKFP